jgi:hypothetical protein
VVVRVVNVIVAEPVSVAVVVVGRISVVVDDAVWVIVDVDATRMVLVARMICVPVVLVVVRGV